MKRSAQQQKAASGDAGEAEDAQTAVHQEAASSKPHPGGGTQLGPWDVALVLVCFSIGWALRELTAAQSSDGYPTGVPARRGLHALSASFASAEAEAAHVEQLVREVQRHAPRRIVKKCVAMVRGDKLESFAQGRQDWVLYHTFFRHLAYGEGFYVDAGANDPEVGSNTFFFDACLGWRGICVEPNPQYARGFRKKRTCKHLKNCIAAKEAQMVLADADKGTKGFVSSGGKGLSVLCRRLQDILTEAGVGRVDLGQPRIDLVSLDIEGHEYSSLRCFPFDAFDAPVWLLETRHQKGHALNDIMGRAGYWMSPTLLVPWAKNLPPFLGALQDNIFVRWRRPGASASNPSNATTPGAAPLASSLPSPPGLVPALVLGPGYTPGGPLEGAAFLPPCTKGKQCPPHLPSVDAVSEVQKGQFVNGECPPFDGFRHRLST